jgi:predicted nucleotidyltransferase component of viral defense system
MIAAAELRRLAGAWNADFTMVERDYVLSWVLAGLYQRPALAELLVFKGGTALRKCYFPDYRFSADLDFTLRASPTPQELRSEIEAACRAITEEAGLRLVPVDFRTLRDVPGEEAHQGRIEYTGPLGRLGGDQPRIKLDLTIYETLVLPPQHRPVHHPYSDADSLDLTAPVYALDEMLAEKLRAMLRRAQARDLYDVWQLFTRYAEALDFEQARDVLTEKAQYKGFTFSSANDFLTTENRETWARSWEASLRRQVPVLAEYDQVIAEAERALVDFLTQPGSRFQQSVTKDI